MLYIHQTPSLTEAGFDADDASTEYDEDEQIISRRMKGKGRAINVSNTSHEDPGLEMTSDIPTADWTKYDPPEGLRYTGDMKSDIVLQIIRTSIERVKARIQEEAKRMEEEALGTEDEGSTEVESAESSSDESSTQSDELEQSISAGRNGWESGEIRVIPTEIPRPQRRRTLRDLFRKTNGNPQSGESSAVGAAHPKLQLGLNAVDFVGRKHFFLDLVKKATGEDTRASPAISNIECVSCLDEFGPKDIVKAPCHNYCKPCFRRLIATACQNEQHWPPKCCLNEFPYRTIILNLDERQKTEYRARAMEWDLPFADRIYCSEPGCSLFIQPVYIIHAQGIARCTRGHYTCIICRNAQHQSGNCPQDRDMMRTNQLAEEEGWKRCYSCHAYVEHLDACQHMTCRCGAEFCYVCGARWRTCACSMTELATIKHQARVRRQERMEREEREEKEMQEAIRLVEEFEREEALKSERLSRERERLAQELRQKEREEHNRRERERRKAITLKYEELRGVFLGLHEMQRAVVRKHQDWYGQRAKLKYEEALTRMRDNHELERMFHRAKVEAKLIKREGRLRSEFVARVAEERRIEEQYAVKLHAFWDKKEGGDEKIQAAMEDLKRRMNMGSVAWQKWAKNDLDTYRDNLHKEQAIREKLMDYKEHHFETRMGEQGIAMATRNAAELRWVREVCEERTRLLHELEAKEIENGEDISK